MQKEREKMEEIKVMEFLKEKEVVIICLLAKTQVENGRRRAFLFKNLYVYIDKNLTY